MTLTDAIRQPDAAANGICGSRRVHAEPALGYGIQVWHGNASVLMGRDGLQGVAERLKFAARTPA